ncbi:MAG: aminotransferase class V-fold PLP-dependent enzyme [Planctomycetes bacterium]|nr:aminotransferase class V-fold PLP-dependent enzyme [Planctomycetota bacterium]
MSSRRIYLDNAATSFPKPVEVYDAVDRYQREVGAAIGRGAYRQAFEAQGIVDRCRRRAAEFLGAESPERIVFTFNGTDSLNLALYGLLRPGDHVVTSTIEHNSVLRPLRELRERLGIAVSYVPCDEFCRVDPAAFQRAMRPETRLIALVHASNVTGTIQPITDVGELAREAGVLFLVDAAQTAGHVPIDLAKLPVDLLACPGHKGLLGPLGTGLLYIRPGIEERLTSIRQGGTGSKSEDDLQPRFLPDKYEAGNHNALGLAGLEAALQWLTTPQSVSQHRFAEELAQQLRVRLATIGDSVKVHSYDPEGAHDYVGVVSITVADFEPQDVASILDESFGIQTRAGLHCAPGAHRALGTLAGGGTVRFSVGPFTTSDDIEAAVAAVQEIAASRGIGG